MVLIQYVMKAECLRSFSTRTTDTGRLNLYIFAAKIQIPIPNNLLVCEYKGLVSCRNNDLMMENMDKEFTLLKCVLIIWPKILQTPQNLSAQAQKFWISMKEGFIERPWFSNKQGPIHSRSKQRTDQRVLVLTLKFLVLKNWFFSLKKYFQIFF